MTVTMTRERDTQPESPAPQHAEANERGIPSTPEERRKARRAFMVEHKGAYEALAE